MPETILSEETSHAPLEVEPEKLTDNHEVNTLNEITPETFDLELEGSMDLVMQSMETRLSNIESNSKLPVNVIRSIKEKLNLAENLGKFKAELLVIVRSGKREIGLLLKTENQTKQTGTPNTYDLLQSLAINAPPYENKDSKPKTDIAYKRLGKNIANLGYEIDNLENEKKRTALITLNKVTENENIPNGLRKKLKGLLEKQCEQYTRTLPNSFDSDLLNIALKNINERAIGDLKKKLFLELTTNSTDNQAKLDFDLPRHYENAQTVNFIKSLYTDVISYWGISGSEALEIWESGKKMGIEDTIRGNIKAIRSLEKHERGTVQTLNSEFGIFHFDRYPVDILIKQYENRNNVDTPYGVALTAYRDHNGIISRQIGKHTRDIENDLKDQYLLRIIECGSKIDIGRRLIALNNKYGKNHKISYMLVSAHGNPEVMRFGNNDKGGLFRISDLAGKWTRKGKSFLEKNATIILLSCSTGVKDGIGQKISKDLSVQIIAPNGNGYLESLQANSSENGINFNTTYVAGSEDGSTITPVETKVYIDGNETK